MLVDEGLEILDEAECRRLLGTGTLGRVAVTVGALPTIFPVNYRVIDDAVYFCTSPGTKLAKATSTSVVAFEVDGGLDATYHEGWSVLVVGRAEEVTDPGDLEVLDERLPRPWAPGLRSHVVRVPIEVISGRRIRHEW